MMDPYPVFELEDPVPVEEKFWYYNFQFSRFLSRPDCNDSTMSEGGKTRAGVHSNNIIPFFFYDI